MRGKEYIESNYIEELSYDEALKQSMKELKAKGVKRASDVYNNEWLFDEPIYPLNAELYDDFCENVNGEWYFYEESFLLYLSHRIEEDELESEE